MKLKQIVIEYKDLQSYLDKYQDKIKFMFILEPPYGKNKGKFVLIVDESVVTK